MFELRSFDYIVDTMGTLSSKLLLISRAREGRVPVISCLDIGDKIQYTTKLGTRTYRVTSVEKVSETDRSSLTATAENCLTLYTCVRNQSAYRWCVRAVEV